MAAQKQQGFTWEILVSKTVFMTLEFKTIQLPLSLDSCDLNDRWLLISEGFIPPALWDSLYKKRNVFKDESLNSPTRGKWLYKLEAISEIVSLGQTVLVDGITCQSSLNIAKQILQNAWGEYFGKLKLHANWSNTKNALVKEFLGLLDNGEDLGINIKCPPKNPLWPSDAEWIPFTEHYLITESNVYGVEYVEPSHENIYPVLTRKYPLTSSLYKVVKQLESLKREEQLLPG